MVFGIMSLGVGRQRGMLGLGSWPQLSRMEQLRETAGGRPLKMLESREGYSVSKGEHVDIQRSARIAGMFRLISRC